MSLRFPYSPATALPFAALAAALALAPVARADDEETEEEEPTSVERLPDEGDLVHGAKLFKLHCADCHGASGAGNGPLAAKFERPLAKLRDGDKLWARSDADLVKSFTLGVPASETGGMPIHARRFSELEARDLLAWLRAPVPRIRDFFPNGAEYIAHEHSIDGDGQDRAKKALGRPLTDDERNILVYTVYKPATGRASGRARKIDEEPRSLYEAKPKRKVGFVTFLGLTLDDGTRLDLALALDRNMRIHGARTLPAADEKSEAARKKLEPVIASFVGGGGREDKKPVEPQQKGVKAGKDLIREMQAAYVVALEGVAMFQKEERDRFWADPDAFKQEIEDMPEDVKFEFKEQKKK